MGVLHFRVIRHVGCPHGCGEPGRGSAGESLRCLSQALLAKLHRASRKHFNKFFKTMVATSSVPDLIDFFHAYVGFCVDPASLLSPLSMLLILLANNLFKLYQAIFLKTTKLLNAALFYSIKSTELYSMILFFQKYRIIECNSISSKVLNYSV